VADAVPHTVRADRQNHFGAVARRYRNCGLAGGAAGIGNLEEVVQMACAREEREAVEVRAVQERHAAE
jgi:hypothetical protein